MHSIPRIYLPCKFVPFEQHLASLSPDLPRTPVPGNPHAALFLSSAVLDPTCVTSYSPSPPRTHFTLYTFVSVLRLLRAVSFLQPTRCSRYETQRWRFSSGRTFRPFSPALGHSQKLSLVHLFRCCCLSPLPEGRPCETTNLVCLV